MGKGNNPRPILITILGILSMVFGLLTVLGSVLILAGVSVVAGPIIGTASASVTGILGLVSVFVGYGFLKGWKIMWYLGVIIWVLILLSSLIMIVAGGLGSIIEFLFALIVLLYLFSRKVKNYFLG